MQGILSGRAISEAVNNGEIYLDPYDSSRLNPASYDLTLGPKVAVYSGVVNPNFEAPNQRFPPGCNVTPKDRCLGAYLDSAKRNEVAEYEMDGRGLLLKPGIGYLMHTVERIRTDRYVPIIDGKSSIGRLFAFVHVTAGYGDPGFDGQYTLEVAVIHPLMVYPGMRFCQMRFHTLVGEAESYQSRGNYRGELAEGPIPSQSYKMFGASGTGREAGTGPEVVLVPAPGDACGNTRKLPDGTRCPGCRACS